MSFIADITTHLFLYCHRNGFEGEIDNNIIRSVVDALVSKSRLVDGAPMSLADLGYARLGIDDGWQSCGSGPGGSYHAHDGTPLVNRSRFPSLKSLVNYGHGAGLLMDFYHINCICMDTYILNANKTWAYASWKGNIIQLRDAGFDGIKIDNCGDDNGVGYAVMKKEIEATGRPLLIENCNQAHGSGPPRGLPNNSSGWCDFHMFRTGGDIRSSFGDVIAKLQRTIPYQDIRHPISRPGCWAFPDMLEVGNFDSDLEVIESRTHFSAWCIVSSPLMLSFDVTDEDRLDKVWDVISNREAIAINQDWAGHPGRLVLTDQSMQVWTKRLSVGQAVLFINRGEAEMSASVALEELGLPPGEYRIQDIWKKRHLPSTISERIETNGIEAHDCWLIKLVPIEKLMLEES